VVAKREISAPCRELNPSQQASIHLLVIHLSRVLSEKSAFVVELDLVRWKYADTNIYIGLSGIEYRWGRDFLYPSRPVLGPIEPPIQWVPCPSWG